MPVIDYLSILGENGAGAELVISESLSLVGLTRRIVCLFWGIPHELPVKTARKHKRFSRFMDANLISHGTPAIDRQRRVYTTFSWDQK
jgi:hypothetical protein